MLTLGEDFVTITCNKDYITKGLTKREYFAVMAMQGLLSTQLIPYGLNLDLSKKAIAYADALIEELNKPTKV
jgi:hypothetical protein